MKAVYAILAALLLSGCEDFYRYPCQDPANREKAECNRPACEADGMCYDTLNGLEKEEAPQVVIVKETPVPPSENIEETGE